MWDPPRPGREPVSPALAGRFSTTAPPGKPLDKFLSVKFGNLHVAQVDDKSTCSEPSTLLGMQAWGIELLPLPGNLAYFLIVVLLGKIEQNFSKGHKIPSHQRIVKMWLLWVPRCVWREMSKTHKLLFPSSLYRRALQNTPLKWSCIFWFPNSWGKSTRFLFCFSLVFIAFRSEFSLVKSVLIKGSEMLKSPLTLWGIFLFVCLFVFQFCPQRKTLDYYWTLKTLGSGFMEEGLQKVAAAGSPALGRPV